VAPLDPVRGVRDVRGWPAVIQAAVKHTAAPNSPQLVARARGSYPRVYTITTSEDLPEFLNLLCQADAAGACRRLLSADKAINININNLNCN
jgi:hypothetical protein